MSGTLAKGSSGRDVQELQRRLNLCVKATPRLIEDGLFGDKTRARVLEFQRAKGLVADGVVGRDTEKVLVLATPLVSTPAYLTEAAIFEMRRAQSIAERSVEVDAG